MGGRCQSEWEHTVPKTAQRVGPADVRDDSALAAGTGRALAVAAPVDLPRPRLVISLHPGQPFGVLARPSRCLCSRLRTRAQVSDRTKPTCAAILSPGSARSRTRGSRTRHHAEHPTTRTREGEAWSSWRPAPPRRIRARGGTRGRTVTPGLRARRLPAVEPGGATPPGRGDGFGNVVGWTLLGSLVPGLGLLARRTAGARRARARVRRARSRRGRRVRRARRPDALVGVRRGQPGQAGLARRRRRGRDPALGAGRSPHARLAPALGPAHQAPARGLHHHARVPHRPGPAARRQGRRLRPADARRPS